MIIGLTGGIGSGKSVVGGILAELGAHVIDTDKLGRVMSIYAVAFFGGMPLGALLLGFLADGIGPMTTFLVAGIGVLLAGLMYRAALPHLREISRPLYVRLGLLPSTPTT